MDKAQLIRTLLESQTNLVISTIGDDTPEAALVAYASAHDLSLVFATYSSSRKYINIQMNPNVAVVISDNALKSVQYEGKAEVLAGDELKKYKEMLFHRNPKSVQYDNHPEQTYLKIIPTWIRYIDLELEPELVFEIKL